MKMKKIIISILVIVLLVIGGIAIYFNNIVSTGFNIDKTVYITIGTDKNYNRLLSDLDTIAKIRNLSNFDRIAGLVNYPDNMRTGRFAVTPDMNIWEVLQVLRNGIQSPVNLKFNNIRTKEDLAIRLSGQLMLTESELLGAFNDSVVCARYGFTPQTIVAMFIPNTYEVYWDTKLDMFLSRMDKEYKRFWTEERLSKAEAIQLSPIEVSILASIVEEECTYSDEYPVVAGLYLNRLHRGQALQADPTVKFAVGDFSLRRILNKHLEIRSPYNTYQNIGLPPGPIRIPSIKGIDAVLNYSRHNYLYMCAKEDFSGRHNFAVTFGEHQQNANKYRQALNRRGIY